MSDPRNTDVPSDSWLPVIGYEGFYDVSYQARVWSVPRLDALGREQGGFFMKTSAGSAGYPVVALTREGRTTHCLVHRLVAAAFIGSCPDGEEVRHKDGIRTHCWASNLEYGTSSENQFDKVRHGTHHYANRDACSKGHEFTPETSRIRLAPDGTFKQRICLRCRRDRVAAITAAKPPVITPCATCGQPFEKPQEVGKARKRYCSEACLKVARTAQTIASQKRAKRANTI